LAKVTNKTTELVRQAIIKVLAPYKASAKAVF